MKTGWKLASFHILCSCLCFFIFLGLLNVGSQLKDGQVEQNYHGSGENLNKHCTFLPQKSVKKYFFDPSQIPSKPFISFLDAWLKPDEARYSKAPEAIPSILLNDFTMNNQISLTKYYFDRAYLGDKALQSEWTETLISEYLKKASNKEDFTYNNQHLYNAFSEYKDEAIKGKHGLVIGSETPWLEAMLLHYDASHVTTLEYGSINSTDDRISTVQPSQFSRKFFTGYYSKNQFDFAASFSSLEHDGLGRYGDILNPFGDFQSIVRLMTVIKPGGFLFLGVPADQKDSLAYNAHRIYGPIRYLALLSGYHFVDMFLEVDQPVYQQPLIVLQNRYGCEAFPQEKIFFV